MSNKLWPEGIPEPKNTGCMNCKWFLDPAYLPVPSLCNSPDVRKKAKKTIEVSAISGDVFEKILRTEVMCDFVNENLQCEYWEEKPVIQKPERRSFWHFLKRGKKDHA